MGKYRRIQKLIEQNVPDFTNLNLVPRGTPFFPDLLMTGEMRFARRLGANFAVMNPDNQVSLATDANVEQNILTLERTLPWFEVGALLTFNYTEMMPITDFDPSQNIVFLSQPLSNTVSAGTPVTLWATPLFMHANAAAGVIQIAVHSRYHVLNGDAVTMPTSSSINSLKEITVVTADFLGDSGDPEFPFLFNLTLQEPIPVALVENLSGQIYLRAFPGYLSNALNVPKLSAGQMGPFLLDYVASPLDSIPDYDEYFSIRTLDGGSNAIVGTATALQTAARNVPVLHRPIWAENMLFWKVLRGSGGFISPNKYRLITGSDGKARVSTNLVPAWSSGLAWSFKVTATSTGLLRIFSDPVGFQDYTLPVNTPTVVTFSTPPGQQLTRLDFITKLDVPGAEVVISDSTPLVPVAAQIQYGFVFRVTGEANFQSTSVIVKPYFLSLSDLTDRYDTGKTYNSGLIYL